MKDHKGDHLFEVLLRSEIAADDKSSDEECTYNSVHDHGEEDEIFHPSACSCTTRLGTSSVSGVTENDNQCCVCFHTVVSVSLY